MSELEFGHLLGVLAIAATAPLLLGLAPRLRLPAVVLELCAGIALGPDGLGWLRAGGSISSRSPGFSPSF